MHYWCSAESDAVQLAVRQAAEGAPTVLVVEGGAGCGKTSLLSELVAWADDFEVLEASGVEGVQPSYATIDQYGLSNAAEQQKVAPFVAAQWLRARLDQVPPQRPVLMLIDDLHWADAESIEAVAWLMRRAHGDRLLVAAAYRPLREDQHGGWQRWVRSARNVLTVRLSGLTLDATVELARDYWGDIDRAELQPLWRHTAGNPLYLTALLEEYDPSTLALSRTLPAPAQYRELTSRKLARLPSPTRQLLEVAAVLGDGWWNLTLVTELAEVTDGLEAAQRGMEAGLNELQIMNGVASIRMSHALSRAAVYDATPWSQRRELHLRAAATVNDPALAMEHRIAVADRWDPGLAAELEEQATALHNDGSHRAAVKYWAWASTLTADRMQRQRRDLEGLLDRVQTGEHFDLGGKLGLVDHLADPTMRARTAVIRGTAHVLAGRWRDAIQALTEVEVGQVSDSLARYRLEVLLAWSRMNAGAAASVVLDGLDRANQTGASEPALEGMAYYGRTIVVARNSNPEDLADAVPPLAEAPEEVPLAATLVLSWRGHLANFRGFYPEAIRDGRAVISRVYGQGNVFDPAQGGGHHAYLGVAYWMSGQWDQAQLLFRLSREVTVGEPIPLALTYYPLHPCAVGELDIADRGIAEAMRVLQDLRWFEAVQSLLILRVVRLHVDGTSAQRSDLMADMRRRWPELTLDLGLISAPWLMHAAVAWIWASELDRATATIDRMSALREPAPWVSSAVSWLRGLVAEERGDLDSAVELLLTADTDAFSLPFYRAHARADLARVQQRRGNHAGADAALADAFNIYASLKAQSYLERIRSQQSAKTDPRASTHVMTPVRLLPGAPPLTDRERDVLTLILSGLSYVQVARELFVTQNTVSYHLRNIYAKTGVRSRHQLVELSRLKSATIPIGSTP